MRGRWRLYGTVDGDRRQRTRSVARRRAHRCRRGRVRGERTQRRLHGVESDPRHRQRAGALPRRDRAARAARAREPRRHRERHPPLRHRLRLRAHRRHRCGDEGARTELRRRATRRRAPVAAPRPGRPLARPRGDARRGRLPDVRRWAVAHRSGGVGRPGETRLGLEDGGGAARRADLRGHEGHRPRSRRRRCARAHAAGRCEGGPRGARDERLQAAAAPAPPLHRPGLRLLHGHRAAHRVTAVEHRLAPPSRAVRHPEPVPLLPIDRGQPDRVGRLRRRLLLAGSRVCASWRADRRRGRR